VDVILEAAAATHGGEPRVADLGKDHPPSVLLKPFRRRLSQGVEPAAPTTAQITWRP
jgi:hypothetical protein